MTRVKFLWVEGDDAGEFADLADACGVLKRREGGRLTFFPDGRGDWLQMDVQAYETDANGRLRVLTALGNTFVFREGG